MTAATRWIISVLALSVFVVAALACGGGTPPDSNIEDLDASARFSGTQFIVQNKGTVPWTDVELA